MIRCGNAPYLECSSKGDKRFSAFWAKIAGRGNRSIEALYQAAKIFEDGETGLDWRAAKGRKAVNQAEVSRLYSILWDEYLLENPELMPVLLAQSGLQDIFGQAGHCCQATELWRIRCAALARCVSIQIETRCNPAHYGEDLPWIYTATVINGSVEDAMTMLEIDLGDCAGMFSTNIQQDEKGICFHSFNSVQIGLILSADLSA